MRLINTTTLKLKEFPDADRRRYAILSHRWAENEVSYQDWMYVTKQFPPRWGWEYLKKEVDRIKASSGYKKVEKACMLARQDDWEWIWADTCCIDKTNLAELSEAINSMYRWYENSATCYAYLQDVESFTDGRHNSKQVDESFRRSEWFKRGWTLQELIAPIDVVFISRDWERLFNKHEKRAVIHEITGIPEVVLQASVARYFYKPRVSDIFSWAARRTTTRIEDRAYCLLGLVGINMPLLYGEGDKAFRRLQLEIARNTQDLSFLAWSFDARREILNAAAFPHPNWGFIVLENALAYDARSFRDSGRDAFSGDASVYVPMQVTNAGISFESTVVSTLNPSIFLLEIPETRFWIPVVAGSNGSYARIGAPFRAIDAPRPIGVVADMVQRERERRSQVTLLFKSYNLTPPTIPHDPIPDNNCPFHVLLTLTSKKDEFGVGCVYPRQPYGVLAGLSILGLTVAGELPEYAYGAIEFCFKDYKIALLVAVHMSKVQLGPSRWMCRSRTSAWAEDPEWDMSNMGYEAAKVAWEFSQKKYPRPAYNSETTTRLEVIKLEVIQPPKVGFSPGGLVLSEQLYPLGVPRPQFNGTGLAQQIYATERDRFTIMEIEFPKLIPKRVSFGHVENRSGGEIDQLAAS